MALNFEDSTTWNEELTEADALSLAIWACNTLLAPEASTLQQFETFDFFAESTIEKLDVLREERA